MERLRMSRFRYSAAIIAAMALILVSGGIGTSSAASDFEWTVVVVVDAGAEEGKTELEFGIHHSATDGYDSGIDVPHPPEPPIPPDLDAYLSIVHMLFPKLNKDFRGEMPNEWTLEVSSTHQNIQLSWNTADVPPPVTLRLVSGAVDIDMKAESSITLQAGRHAFTVIAGEIDVAQYELTIFSTGGGEVTTPGEGTLKYDARTIVNLVAEPHEGYRFVQWTGDVGTLAGVNSASTTITVRGDYSITANFAKIPPGPDPVDRYELIISSTAGGSVTLPGEGTFTYDQDTVIDLAAESDEAYRFVHWSGDVGTIADVTAASTTITMQGDHAITVVFEELTPPADSPDGYELIVSSTTGGSVTVPGEGTFDYDDETVVALMAEADGGYRFANWSGDVSAITAVNSAETTITMDGDYTVAANFEEIRAAAVNWLLIGAILATVMVAGLIALLLSRRRSA